MPWNRIIKYINHIKEYYLWRKLKAVLPNNPTIIEGGAHLGLDSVKMSAYWENGKIYAIEAVPSIFEQLKTNTASYNNIVVYNFGLSDNIGETDIYLSSGKSIASSSILKPKDHLVKHPEVYFNTTCRINTITLTEFVKLNTIKKVDFIWLDIQGMELQVLKAGKNALNNVKAVFLEVNHLENYEGCNSYDEVKQWMLNNNFRIGWKGIQYKDAGNVLFIKNNK